MMKKKNAQIFLCILLLLSVTCQTVFAKETILQLTKHAYDNEGSDNKQEKGILKNKGAYTLADVDKALDNLKEKGQLADLDENNLSILHYLVKIPNSIRTVEKLLNNSDFPKEYINRTFPDFTDYKEVTPLFYAVLNNNTALAEVLIAKGADPNKTAIKIGKDGNPDYKGTPLYHAVRNKNYDVIRALIKSSKLNINEITEPVYADGDTFTALTSAVLNNDNRAVEMLLRYDANPNIVTKYKGVKETALSLAVKNQQRDIVETLLNNPNTKVDFPVEGINRADNYTSLFYAVWNEDDKTIDMLLKAGADPNYKANFEFFDEDGNRSTSSNRTPLAHCTGVNKKHIAQMLIDNGADVNIGSDYADGNFRTSGYTPLFDAIYQGDAGYFELIYKYSDVSKLKYKREGSEWKIEDTPFTFAIRQEKINEKIVDMLLDAASYKQTITFSEGEPMMAGEYLRQRSDLSGNLRKRVEQLDTEIRIWEAIDNDNYKLLHEALSDGKKPDIEREKQTTLEVAIEKALDNNVSPDNKNIILDLIKYGADVNKSGSKNITMLAHLVNLSMEEGLNSNKQELIKLLLENGANATKVIKNDLPLIPYIAEELGTKANFEVLNFLFDEFEENVNIKYKASVDQQVSGGDKNNWTATCFAIENGNETLLKYLLDKGADKDKRIKQDASNDFNLLALACVKDKQNCVETLLSAGASTNNNKLQIYGANNVSLLMTVCSTMPWSIVERLLKGQNADFINKTDSKGRNAFMYAAIYNKNPLVAQKVLRNLRGRKADINAKAAVNNAVSLAITEMQNISTVMWLLQNGVEFMPVPNDVMEQYLEKYKSDKQNCELLKNLNNK